MPPKEIKTTIKSTPAEVAPTKDTEVKANLSQELELEHPNAKIIKKLTDLIEYAKKGEFSTLSRTLALSIGVKTFETPVIVPEDITDLLSSSNATTEDIVAATETLQNLIDLRDSRLLTKVVELQSVNLADAKTKQEEAEAKLKEFEKKKRPKKKKDSRYSKRSYSGSHSGSSSDSSTDESSGSSSSSEEEVVQISVQCKANSKIADRKAKSNSGNTIDSSIIKCIDQYILASENGKSQDARTHERQLWTLLTKSLTLSGDGAGGIPLSESAKRGHLGGGSEGTHIITKGSSKHLSQTLNSSNTNDGTDDGSEFTNTPIEPEEMDKFIEKAEEGILDRSVSLPNGASRKGHGKIVLNKELNLALAERQIAQLRGFLHFASALKKKDQYIHQDAYLTIICRLEELLKHERETPMASYERPTEFTLIARIAKKHLHLCSYLMGEIQKLNKDQAAATYHVNAFGLFQNSGQMSTHETASAFLNRAQKIRDDSNRMIAPFNPQDFNWPHNATGTHDFFNDKFLAYFVIINLNRVLVPRDINARNYITESLLKRATKGEVDMDEVHELIAQMNKLGIGAVKLSTKTDVKQSQSFSSINEEEAANEKKRGNRPNGNRGKRDTGKSSSQAESARSSEGKLQHYAKAMQDMGNDFKNINKQIDLLNDLVDKVAQGDGKFVQAKEVDGCKRLLVGRRFGTTRRIKMPGKAMGDKAWGLFQAIRDIFGSCHSGELSRIGRRYMERHDPKIFRRIENWRLKHGVKAQPGHYEEQRAHSSIRKREKREKLKEKIEKIKEKEKREKTKKETAKYKAKRSKQQAEDISGSDSNSTNSNDSNPSDGEDSTTFTSGNDSDTDYSKYSSGASSKYYSGSSDSSIDSDSN